MLLKYIFSASMVVQGSSNEMDPWAFHLATFYKNAPRHLMAAMVQSDTHLNDLILVKVHDCLTAVSLWTLSTQFSLHHISSWLSSRVFGIIILTNLASQIWKWHCLDSFIWVHFYSCTSAARTGNTYQHVLALPQGFLLTWHALNTSPGRHTGGILTNHAVDLLDIYYYNCYNCCCSWQ